MSRIKVILLTFALALGFQSSAFAEQADSSYIQREATDFFHTYLGTYNKRLGQPDRDADFLAELSALVNKPFIMAPPSATAPFYPESDELFARVFSGFVKQLERKGAVRMEWQQISIQVLTSHKVLANNIGRAFNADGEVVYETISLYLLHRSDSGWKITMFSPYDFAQRLEFERVGNADE